MRMRLKSFAFGCLAIAMAMPALQSRAEAAIITFNEPQLCCSTTFNGELNPYLISSDGQFKVEAFWLSFSGHFHTSVEAGNLAEDNHNQSGAANTLTELQGLHITRVDNSPFSLISMDLFGQASVGQVGNVNTGTGSYTLFTGGGSHTTPASISFGTAFSNVSFIDIVDPFAAGGSSFDNHWDNIELQSEPVPEPASMLLLGSGIVAIAARRRRRRA